MSPKKFYFLYYQMTELLPLFSYLERLNVYRESFATQGTERMSGVLKLNKNSKSDDDKVTAVHCIESTTRGGDSIGECSVCLDNLSDIMLPCLHAFCTQCIELWQAKQSNCPVCRSEILTRCTGMAAFSHGDEFYCIINSGDSIEELAEEISMRVSAATRFILESSPYEKYRKTYNKLYTVADVRRKLAESK